MHVDTIQFRSSRQLEVWGVANAARLAQGLPDHSSNMVAGAWGAAADPLLSGAVLARPKQQHGYGAWGVAAGEAWRQPAPVGLEMLVTGGETGSRKKNCLLIPSI